MKWISVKDRLPEGVWSVTYPHISEEVLVANSYSVSMAFYNRNDWTWYVGMPGGNREWIDKITHWMPLPKNPHV